MPLLIPALLMIALELSTPNATSAPTSSPTTQPSDLRKIIATLQRQVADLKAENQRLKAQLALLEKQHVKNPKQAPDGMYDAMKDPHYGDGGTALIGSQFRPSSPSAAYERVTNGMSFDEVLSVLGGYQKDRETDDLRSVEWLFVTASGGDLTITVRFKAGSVSSKSKDSRG